MTGKIHSVAAVKKIYERKIDLSRVVFFVLTVLTGFLFYDLFYLQINEITLFLFILSGIFLI